MNNTPDNMNCIKNLIQVMVCDGRIESQEKKFLSKAAQQLQVEVENWNTLLKEVLQDQGIIYPIRNRNKAIAALQAMVLMAKADHHLDEREGHLILRFAKSLGLSNQEWKQVLKKIDIQTLFQPFQSQTLSGKILILDDDFEKLDPFVEIVKEHGIQFRITGFQKFVSDQESDEDAVFFHAAPQKETTIDKCRQLLDRSGEKVVSILTRYQGNQVQYLLEQGLRRCIIEPVYSRDLERIFVKA